MATAESSRPWLAVSVVLPVLNEGEDIERLLTEVLTQQAPPGGFEVLVVDGGSTDDTRAIVARMSRRSPQLRLLENPRRLSSAGRNIGAKAARGTYVLYLDGHCALPRDDYLVRVVELFEETGAACLARPQPLNQFTTGTWTAAIATARHSRLGHNPASDIYGGAPAYTDPCSAGAAYARVQIERLGGYDETFDACEDVEFNHRVAAAGLRAYRHPDLTVAYRPRGSLRGLLRQMIRYGRGRARLMAKHPEQVPWPLVMITGIGVVWLALLGIFGWWLGARFALGAAGAYLLAVAGESVRLKGISGVAARMIPAFAVIHLGLLLGFWRGLPEYPRFRTQKVKLPDGRSGSPIDST